MSWRDAFRPARPAPAKRPVWTMPPTEPGSAMSERDVEDRAPGKVDLYKSAGLSLRKNGLLGERVAAYLCLDRSASMNGLYASNTMQDFADRVLALSAHFDDDGVVPTWMFGSHVRGPQEIDIADESQPIQAMTRQYAPMNRTAYAPAIRAITEYHRREAPAAPGFVIFQTDGEAQDGPETIRAITEAANYPIFWQFVGFGGYSPDDFGLLNHLNEMEGRVIDNAGFWWAGTDPARLSNEEIFDGLMNELPEYLHALRAG